jgi:hypothetical protein
MRYQGRCAALIKNSMTKADFFLGRGRDSVWLGSVGSHGRPKNVKSRDSLRWLQMKHSREVQRRRFSPSGGNYLDLRYPAQLFVDFKNGVRDII